MTTDPFSFLPLHLTDHDELEAFDEIAAALEERLYALDRQKAVILLVAFLKKHRDIDSFYLDVGYSDYDPYDEERFLTIDAKDLVLLGQEDYSGDKGIDSEDRAISDGGSTLDHFNHFLIQLGSRDGNPAGIDALEDLEVEDLSHVATDDLLPFLMRKVLGEKEFSAWEKTLLEHQVKSHSQISVDQAGQTAPHDTTNDVPNNAAPSRSAKKRSL